MTLPPAASIHQKLTASCPAVSWPAAAPAASCFRVSTGGRERASQKPPFPLLSPSASAQRGSQEVLSLSPPFSTRSGNHAWPPSPDCPSLFSRGQAISLCPPRKHPSRPGLSQRLCRGHAGSSVGSPIRLFIHSTNTDGASASTEPRGPGWRAGDLAQLLRSPRK